MRFDTRSNVARLILGLVLAGATQLAALPPKKDDQIRIHMLNVGEGACNIIECPGVDTTPPIIFDCGTGAATDAMTAKQVKDYITTVLASRKPVVVVSHPDIDHYKYLPDVGETLFVVLGGARDGYKTEGFKVWLEKQKVVDGMPAGFSNDLQPWELLSCGAAPGYVLTVNSGKDLPEKSPERSNADSLVAQFIYDGKRFTFPGDATAQTLASILRNQLQFGVPSVATTLLAASHHGSNRSGENGFLWQSVFRPPIVVYSSGANMGNPRCPGVRAYTELLPYSDHPMRCWNDDEWETWTSKSMEFLTQLSGTIVLTFGPESNFINCVAPDGQPTECLVSGSK